MQTQIHNVLKPLHLKQKIDESELSKFYNAIEKLKNQTLAKKDESEEHIKSYLIDFIKGIGYGEYTINTHNNIDLAIFVGDTPQVLIEVKRGKNKHEMVSCENLNTKAMHELILYYLTQKHKQNFQIRHLIITNNIE